MRRKTHSATERDTALTRRYKEIGISAVAAAARYQRNGKKKKAAGARSKDKGADTTSLDKGADTTSFRGTSPRR